MERIQLLTEAVLIDKLSEYTAKYSRMHTEGGSEEVFKNCIETIELLTAEIESRKKTAQQNDEIINNSQFIFFEE
jgi:hypothetical protein